VRSEAIERLLPGVFQLALHPSARGVVEPDRRLGATLQAMEALHEPCERVLVDLSSYVDPRLAPPAFVPYLASWVDLDRFLVAAADDPSLSPTLLATGLGRLRELVAAAAELARWRGTALGLRRFLETATGLGGWTIEENVSGPERAPRPFHLRVVGPAEAEPYRPLVERIVAAEKPVAVTHELDFARPAAPRRRRGRRMEAAT
jgi:phage tail-like protein